LAHYCKEGDNFLQLIIAGDETWIYYYQPETKQRSVPWKDLSSPVAEKFKVQLSMGNLMLTIFWDSQGPILETYPEHGTIVTNATYSDMLQREMKPAIRSKRRGRLSEGAFLLHDNAHPRTAARTLETLRKLMWEVMEHPAHSPDLAPSDFHLFGPLKVALAGRRCRCDEDVQNTVHQWLREQTKTFYYDDIKKLVGRWEKCVEKQGDYVEK
jgi:histone-lysine N-methyltransferase SETMAR